MVEAQNRTREVLPRKEMLGEPATAELLAAIGNHEGKALLLITLGLGPANSIGSTRMDKLVRTRQGAGRSIFNISTMMGWCDPAMTDCGLLSKHTTSDGVTEFIKKKEGQLAEALAGPLLALSESDDKVSLSQLVGVSTSVAPQKSDPESGMAYKIRPPLTRLRIYRELLATAPGEKLSFDDLVDSLMTKYPEDYARSETVTSVLQTHLYNTARPEIINLTLGQARERTARYTLRAEGERPDRPPIWTDSELVPTIQEIIDAAGSTELPQREDIYHALQSQSPTLVADMTPQGMATSITDALRTLTKGGYLGRKLVAPIWNIIRESGVDVPVERNDILDTLIAGDPELAKTIKTTADPQLADAYTHTLLVAISRSLRFMEKEGYIDHTDKRTEIKSIELTDPQRNRLAKYVKIVDDFRSLDPTILAKGLATADQFLHEPDRYFRLMQKAKEFGSPQISLAETAQRIYQIVNSHPEGIAVRQITEELFHRFEHSLSTGRVRDYLDKLEEAQLLSSIQEGSNRKKKYTSNEAVDNDRVNGQIKLLFKQIEKTPRKKTKRYVSPGERRRIAAEDAIRSQIISGELKVGEPLDVKDLLRRYQISRASLSRIFRKLDSEGFLERNTGRHSIIVTLPEQNKRGSQRDEDEQTQKDSLATERQTIDINDIPYFHDNNEWTDEVKRKGGIPVHRTRSYLKTPSESIARVLKIQPEHLINETRRTRGITSSISKTTRIYDMTQTFVPLLWLNQLYTDEANLPLQVHAFADPEKTKERTRKRIPVTPDEAKRYGIDSNAMLITHVTYYSNKNGIPFAIKVHTIPETRAPQEYLDAFVVQM